MYRTISTIAASYLKLFFTVILIIGFPVKARSTTMTTTATGSFSPSSPTSSLPLDDYHILSQNDSSTEYATPELSPWAFNVALDPTFEQLIDPDTLKSAVLTLTLKPELENADSGTVMIQDFSDNHTPGLRNLSAQMTTTIEVELLNVYSAEDLLDALKHHAGKLPIAYPHPEKISSVELRLTTEVPDRKKRFIGGGIAVLLCMAGWFGYVKWRRKILRNLPEKPLRDDRLATIGQLTSSVIHDVKNSFTAIRSCAEVMAEDGLEPDERKDFAQMIVQEIERGVDMTQEILEYSRGTALSLHLQEVSLHTLLQDVIAVVSPNFTARRMTLNHDIQDSGKIMADEEKIQRVFMNLISNARDAMTDGGTLTISTRTVHNSLQLEFTDTGCGMSSELQARVFEPFVTEGKPRGTGLGMAIVKDILDAHQARIEIESIVNQGTTIRIFFPQHHAAPRS